MMTMSPRRSSGRSKSPGGVRFTPKMRRRTRAKAAPPRGERRGGRRWLCYQMPSSIPLRRRSMRGVSPVDRELPKA